LRLVSTCVLCCEKLFFISFLGGWPANNGKIAGIWSTRIHPSTAVGARVTGERANSATLPPSPPAASPAREAGLGNDFEDSIAPLPPPMQQPYMHLASGHGWYATRDHRWRQRCRGYSQLHLPCRRGHRLCRCGCWRSRMTRWSGRAAAIGADRRAAACAAVAAGVFAPETIVPRCLGCRVSSCGRCLRSHILGQQSSSAGDYRRDRWLRRPGARSSRICALRAAMGDATQMNGAGGSSFGHAAG